MEEKTCKKAKNKNRVFGDFIDPLDSILLKPRNSFYCLKKPFGVGFQTLAVENVLFVSWLAAVHQDILK